MYKHGVAYLERSGPADGSFELSFRQGDMNDVLKSLAVGVIRGTAAFGGVGFETPSDSDALLAARKLLLTPGAALTGLLDAVRGRTVEVAANDPESPRFTGTISVRYRRATPLGPLRAEGSVSRIDGIKAYATGHIADADGVTAEADGVFILPRWARG